MGLPGLTSSFGVWALWIAIAAATWATNARTPVRLLYAVSDSGVRAGAGRVVVLLGWPVALVAVALAAIDVDRVLAVEPSPTVRRAVIGAAVLALALCATVALPGAVDPKHVDAKPINAPAAVGVAVAFGLSLWTAATTGRAHGPPRARSDVCWLVLFSLLLVAALPWLLANLGLYAGDVPGLRELFMSKQVRPETGYPHLRAVHLGNHDGLDGLLLALTAVVLMRRLGQMRRLGAAAGVYLSVLVPYGLAVASADWWGEQIVKLGWASGRIANPAYPSLSYVWGGIVVAATVVWLLEVRARRRQLTDSSDPAHQTNGISRRGVRRR
jgi:hypothetical protein